MKIYGSDCCNGKNKKPTAIKLEPHLTGRGISVVVCDAATGERVMNGTAFVLEPNGTMKAAHGFEISDQYENPFTGVPKCRT